MSTDNKQSLPAITLAAIGVVYGDIGTSPLYTLRECLSGQFGFGVERDAVFGFLSLIFWTVVVGPLGAILAVPLTLFFQSLLIDSVPQARWLNSFLGPERPDLPGEDDESDFGARVVRRVRDLAERKPLRVPGASRISRRAVRGEDVGARPGVLST